MLIIQEFMWQFGHGMILVIQNDKMALREFSLLAIFLNPNVFHLTSIIALEEPALPLALRDSSNNPMIILLSWIAKY